MSYCRFSSFDWKSDIYAYQAVNGYYIHVAASRFAGDAPVVRNDLARTDSKAWLASMKAQRDFLDVAVKEPIDLPHAGQTFVEGDLEDFLARLIELRDLGYFVSDITLDSIREEILDETN